MKPRHETLSALIEEADAIRKTIPEKRTPLWADTIDNMRGCLRPWPNGKPRECDRWDEATFRRVQFELLRLKVQLDAHRQRLTP